MDIREAALFQYSFDFFLKLAKESEKTCVWETNQQLFTAEFYDYSLFNSNESSRNKFDLAFKHNVLKNNDFGESIIQFKNDFPLLISTIFKFIQSVNVSEYTLSDRLLAKNVSFIGKNISKLDFYLFPENANFDVVSIISSETLDQNV